MLWPGHEKATLRDYHSFIDYNNFEFKQWWGPDWVRAGLPGYPDGGQDDFTMQLAFLPDFRTESGKAVGLPPILQRKSDTRAVALPDTTVRGLPGPLAGRLGARIRRRRFQGRHRQARGAGQLAGPARCRHRSLEGLENAPSANRKSTTRRSG